MNSDVFVAFLDRSATKYTQIDLIFCSWETFETEMFLIE